MKLELILLIIFEAIIFPYMLIKSILITARYKKALQFKLLKVRFQIINEEYIKAKNKELQKGWLNMLSKWNFDFSENLSFSKFRNWLYGFNEEIFEDFRGIHSDLAKFIDEEAKDLTKSWSFRNGRK
jgi:hypothetical protein